MMLIPILSSAGCTKYYGLKGEAGARVQSQNTSFVSRDHALGDTEHAAELALRNPELLSDCANIHHGYDVCVYGYPCQPCYSSADRKIPFEIGRAHVRTPVTNSHLVCPTMLDKKKAYT